MARAGEPPVPAGQNDLVCSSYEQLAATIFTESTSRRCCDALDSEPVVVPVVPVVEPVVEPVAEPVVEPVVEPLELELELDISLPVT